MSAFHPTAHAVGFPGANLVNPERERLFAELDAMQVVEQTTKKLTVELPGFDTSFLQRE